MLSSGLGQLSFQSPSKKDGILAQTFHRLRDAVPRQSSRNIRKAFLRDSVLRMFRFRLVRGDPEDIGGSGIPGTEGENGGALLYGGPKRTELFKAIIQS